MIEIGQVSRRPCVPSTTIAWSVFACFAVLVGILSMGAYAKKETVAGVVLLRNVVRVVAPGHGYVASLNVQPGGRVQRGQPLLSIHPLQEGAAEVPDTDASIAEVKALMRRNADSEARSRESVKAQRLLFQGQIEDAGRQERIAALERSSIAERVGFAERHLRKLETLARDRFVSSSQVDDAALQLALARQQLLASESAAYDARQKHLELQQRLSELDVTHEALQQERAVQKLDLSERLKRLSRTRRATLFSPASGAVDTAFVSPGDRVEPSQPLLMIRTNDNIEPTIRLDVQAEAVGFVRKGLPVVLRFAAFPYEKFGVVRGVVTRVSPGSLRSPAVPDDQGAGVFHVEVMPVFDADTRIRRHWLKDGMNVSAAVHLQRMTLGEWLFLPVGKALKRNPDFMAQGPGNRDDEAGG